MTWMVAAVVGWLIVAVLVAVLAWALARAAAAGDRAMLAPASAATERGAEPPVLDRRVGQPDRRAVTRPWASGSPGRRAEDVLRQDLAEARRALRDAEARLAEIEARESA